jgi:hypothetical protein
MKAMDVLQAVETVLNVPIVGAEAYALGWEWGNTMEQFLTGEEEKLMESIVSTLLPVDAKEEAHQVSFVSGFCAMIVNRYYNCQEQQVFRNGLAELRWLAWRRYRNEFVCLAPAARKQLITESSDEQFLLMVQQLVLWGYFMSEAGYLKALPYVRMAC